MREEKTVSYDEQNVAFSTRRGDFSIAHAPRKLHLTVVFVMLLLTFVDVQIFNPQILQKWKKKGL